MYSNRCRLFVIIPTRSLCISPSLSPPFSFVLFVYRSCEGKQRWITIWFHSNPKRKMHTNHSVVHRFLIVSARKRVPRLFSPCYARLHWRKHHFKSELWSNRPRRKRFPLRALIKNVQRTYQSLCSTVALILRLFMLINQIRRKLSIFIQTIAHIIRVIQGWIEMLRSIYAAVHLLLTSLRILVVKIYRIFYLLSVLFEPFSNRSFEKAVRSFSRFLYDYYSSNGACYTLKARTHHIISRVRARWKRSSQIPDDDDVYYDALNKEYQWLNLFEERMEREICFLDYWSVQRFLFQFLSDQANSIQYPPLT